MVSTLSGIVISVKLVQLLNPVISVKPIQLLIPTISVKFVQFSKVSEPIYVRLLGIAIVFKLVQSEKLLFPNPLIVSGNITSIKLVHPSKV